MDLNELQKLSKEELVHILHSQQKKRRTKIITENKWARYEDEETHIVFDPVTKEAYGVQDHNTGKLLSLRESHIEICTKKGWKFTKSNQESEDDESQGGKSEGKQEDDETEEESDDESDEESEEESDDETEEESE